MTMRMSRREVEAKISYPPLRKKVPRLEPLSCEVGRAALDTFRKARAAKGDPQRLRMYKLNSDNLSRSEMGASISTDAAGTAPAVNLDMQLTHLLEAIATSEVKDPRHYEGVGDILEEKGRWEDALSYFTKAIALNPMAFTVYLKRGRCFARLSDSMSTTTMTGAEEFSNAAKALAEYKKYLQLGPETKDILVQSGKCALDAHQLDEAEALFNACLALEPLPGDGEEDDAYAQYNLGEVNERRAASAPTPEEASVFMRKATDHYSKVGLAFAGPYYEQALEELLKNRNFPVALRLLEAVVKMVPEDVGVRLWLAHVYSHLGAEFALPVQQALSRAIELPECTRPAPESPYFPALPPHQQSTLLKRALLYLKVLGDVDQAIRDLTLVLALPDPVAGEEAVPPHLGFILALQGVRETALAARAQALLRRNALGDTEAARKDYLKFVSMSSVPLEEKAAAYKFLAEYYFSANDVSTASRYFALATVAGYSPDQPARWYRPLFSSIVQTVAITEAQSALVEGEELRVAGAVDKNGVMRRPAQQACPPQAGSMLLTLPDAMKGSCVEGRGWNTHRNTDPSLLGCAPSLPIAIDAAVSACKEIPIAAAGPSKVEKGTEPIRSTIPCPSASYALCEGWYNAVRSREPTVHRQDEVAAIEEWIPYRSLIERTKEEAENNRQGKKPKKR